MFPGIKGQDLIGLAVVVCAFLTFWLAKGWIHF